MNIRVYLGLKSPIQNPTMSHFSLKSLAFYGTAIGSVLVLFNVVTAYGEKHLKAPPSIDGRYRLQAENLPDCLRSQPLVLMVEQSGIYVRGLLRQEQVSTSPETTAEEKPALSGLWQEQNLNLSGAAPALAACARASVTIDATLERDTLNGQLRLGSGPEAIAFSAKREAAKPKSTSPH
jgi:hypothetical protein